MFGSFLNHPVTTSRPLRWSRLALAAVLLVATLGVAEFAQADQQVYWGTKRPKKSQKPPGNAGNPWTPAGPGGVVTTPVLKKWQSLYIGVNNIHVFEFSKTLTITVTGPGAHKLRVRHGEGYYPYNGRTRTTHAINRGRTTSNPPESATFTVYFGVQPEWEWVRLKNTGSAQAFTITVSVSSECDITDRFWQTGLDSQGMFGAQDGLLGTMAITEVLMFPESVPVDPGVMPTFNAPPGTGPWMSQFVYTDPSGTPRPGGGVQWTSGGPGLAAEDIYSHSFTMMGDADQHYTLYAYDSISGAYQSYERNIAPSIRSWRSVRDHGGAGPLSSDLDPQAIDDDSDALDGVDAGVLDALGALPAAETRAGGIERIEVEFDHAIETFDPTAVSVTDGTASYTPSSVTLQGDRILQIDFLPALPTNHPPYEVFVGSAVPGAHGDLDCLITALEGDVDNDGRITDADVTAVTDQLGQPVEPGNCKYDVDMDGAITSADVAFVLARVGNSIWCSDGLVAIPWYERFEEYDPGTGIIGQGGWKGWDDDPAFDAPVTDVQSRSEYKGLDVAGASDVVHELSYCDSGRWSFSAWQYIPTGFTSGGAGALDGTYFILLNTYNDGGPYNWSAQLQFDSNDGMLKVYHGDGLNTINVPYVTDRWVKIEAIVDLDNDWTQVYYDDSLVTEYSWTGGVLGDGGGVPDIAAVDLYANGSSSVFYDDLVLEKLPEPPPPPCPADLNSDGSVNVLDLLEMLGSWGTCTGCSGDINDDGNVDVLDLLTLLAAWGSCP